MKLTVVGCAPAYTARSGRASSGYLLEHGATRLMLDFGLGVFSELWRYTTPGDLAAIAISHLHSDHNVDLIPLRHWVKYENNGRGPTLHAPAELRQRLTDYQRFVDPQTEPDFLACLTGDALEAGSFVVGDMVVEAARVTHIADSFAFRVSAAGEEAPGLVYSGDCAVADELLPLIRPGDTLLCEAAFGVGLTGGGAHLTVAEAAMAAGSADAGRLILTHILDRNLGPDLAQAAQRFYRGQVLVAEPGMKVMVE